MNRNTLIGAVGGVLAGAGLCALALGAAPWQARSQVETAELISAPIIGQAAGQVAGAAIGQAARWGTLPNLADLVEQVSPSVVQINVRSAAGEGLVLGPNGRPFEGTPFDFFRNFPGAPNQGEQPDRRGSGSGFFIEGGYIVTNHHVVEDAKRVMVVLESGREIEATVVGSDEKTDLAVVKVAGKDLPAALRWGDSNRARAGDSVFAVGAPFGLSNSVTAGIISARGRNINSGPYDDYIQVDAPINRGNSGGPLFDASGSVIGVNSVIFSPSGGNIGIGFAISSELAQSIVKQIIQTGGVQRGWLGVTIQPVTPEMAKGLGLKDAQGAIVADVTAGSPAAGAGLKTGDIILRFGSAPINEVRDLTRAVANTPAGTSREVRILRNGKETSVNAKIALLDEGDGPTRTLASAGATAPTGQALALTSLGLRLANQGGAVVTEVKVNSTAADAGLNVGDRIVMVNQVEVSTAEAVRDAVEAARKQKREAVLMQVQSRDGTRRFVGVAFEE